VLRLICRGRTDVQIGKTLGISHRTVSTHAHSLYRKLGVESRTQAAIKAFRDRKVRR
jgi:DNA-binding NarL/FixJ family response regulator